MTILGRTTLVFIVSKLNSAVVVVVVFRRAAGRSKRSCGNPLVGKTSR